LRYADWNDHAKKCRKTQVFLNRLVLENNYTQVVNSPTRGDWASNGSCMEEIWKRFKEVVFESIDRFVPHKIVRKNPDPEYYNKELKQLKVKVRRVYNKRKLEQRYQVKLKRLSKELLAARKT